MTILIKGMEMPENCGGCKFFAWKRTVGNHCAICEDITFHPTLDGFDVRYDHKGDCPLVPVPTPHGRLIDADDLQELYVNLDDLDISDYDVKITVIRQNIKDMPTIIEAEYEDEADISD